MKHTVKRVSQINPCCTIEITFMWSHRCIRPFANSLMHCYFLVCSCIIFMIHYDFEACSITFAGSIEQCASVNCLVCEQCSRWQAATTCYTLQYTPHKHKTLIPGCLSSPLLLHGWVQRSHFIEVHRVLCCSVFTTSNTQFLSVLLVLI